MESPEKKSQAPWWQPALVLFIKLSSWIAVPVIGAVFVGKWLDKKYNTEPWLFLLSVGVAFAVSMIVIVRKALSEMNKIEKESQDK